MIRRSISGLSHIKDCSKCKHQTASGMCNKYTMLASRARLTPALCGLDAVGYEQQICKSRIKQGLTEAMPMFQLYTQTIVIVVATYLLIL